MFNKPIKVNKRPNTSEGSQFHQPPQVPSCNAHQLPKKSAIKFIFKIFLVKL